FNKGTAGLGHFGTVDGHKTMHVNTGWLAETRTFQHGRPEQAMEVGDILADKMIQLSVSTFVPEAVKVHTIGITVVFKAGHVANRRIYPYVEVFAGCIGNFKTKVGRITAD